MKYICKIVLFLSFAIASFNPSQSYASGGASNYMQKLGDQALAVISNKSINKTQKQQKLEAIFSSSVDFDWVHLR